MLIWPKKPTHWLEVWRFMRELNTAPTPRMILGMSAAGAIAALRPRHPQLSLFDL